jgi:hypothetical protein
MVVVLAAVMAVIAIAVAVGMTVQLILTVQEAAGRGAAEAFLTLATALWRAAAAAACQSGGERLLVRAKVHSYGGS